LAAHPWKQTTVRVAEAGGGRRRARAASVPEGELRQGRVAVDAERRLGRAARKAGAQDRVCERRDGTGQSPQQRRAPRSAGRGAASPAPPACGRGRAFISAMWTPCGHTWVQIPHPEQRSSEASTLVPGSR
jgi:hypothetical protein